MIYITGDIHGDINRFSDEYIPNETELTDDDVIIVCGDFGIPWYNKNDNTGWHFDQRKLDDLSARPYTILYCDGNHENFNELYAYLEIEMYGNTVNKLRDNIFHLQRGRIYTIQDKTFFVFGGAYSIDRYMRQKNISYWEQEIPCDSEYKKGIKALKSVGFKVDYIITHTCPSEIIRHMGHNPIIDDGELTGFFDWVMYETDFKKWFFGHWHYDELIIYKDKCLRAIYFDTVSIY